MTYNRKKNVKVLAVKEHLFDNTVKTIRKPNSTWDNRVEFDNPKLFASYIREQATFDYYNEKNFY